MKVQELQKHVDVHDDDNDDADNWDIIHIP